jgi:hypothetical protein
MEQCLKRIPIVIIEKHNMRSSQKERYTIKPWNLVT